MKTLFFSSSRVQRGNPTRFDALSGLTPRTSFSEGRGLSLRSRQAINSFAITIFLLLSLFASAQDKDEPFHPEQPAILFDLYWEAATPQNYTITLQASGQAKYVSRNPTRIPQGQDAADPDYLLEFTMTPSTRDQIFTLAKELNYFNGNFDFKHRVANTGAKTLTYADPVRYFKATYNYSENRSIQEITRIFQGISNTVEHGRKLQFLRRFDKLGLERELEGMEQMAHSGYLAEIQIIAPTLQNIINDSTVLNMARERARRLLESHL